MSAKKIEKILRRRNKAEAVLEKNVVEKWLENEDMNFMENCIFIDEAGFNFHTLRTNGWAKIGEPCKEVTQDQGVSMTNDNYWCHLLFLSLRTPEKQRKRNNQGNDVSTTIGTTGEYFLAYMEDILSRCLG
jgi:hypothetical protein